MALGGRPAAPPRHRDRARAGAELVEAGVGGWDWSCGVHPPVGFANWAGVSSWAGAQYIGLNEFVCSMYIISVPRFNREPNRSNRVISVPEK